jgi:hypothetical protein
VDSSQRLTHRTAPAATPGTQTGFHFIHAADLRLDTPCSGSAAFPAEYRDHVLDARFLAAERVFATAIARQARFVLLTGEILSLNGEGVRGPAFLWEQTRRLAAHGIPVVWPEAASVLTSRWPSSCPVPETLHWYGRATQRPELSIETPGRPDVCPCRIVDPAALTDRQPASESVAPFTVAVRQSGTPAPASDPIMVHYWALGGRPVRHTFTFRGGIAHDPGPPQGRHSGDVGSRGCSEVRVVPGMTPAIEFHPTDAVRWHRIRVPVPPMTSGDALLAICGERLRELAAGLRQAPHVRLGLIRWELCPTETASVAAWDGWGRPDAQDRLLDRLRKADSSDAAPLWSFALDIELDDAWAADHEPDATHWRAFLEELRQIPSGAAPSAGSRDRDRLDVPSALPSGPHWDSRLQAEVACAGSHWLSIADARGDG